MNLPITNVRKNYWLLGMVLLAGWFFVPEAIAQSTTLVEWNFPNNPDDAIADGGISANLSKTIATGSTGVCGTTIGTATFNNSPTNNFALATNWDAGANCKYWVVDFNTTGYSIIKLSSVIYSTLNAPKYWKVQYRIGTGGAWTDISGGAITASNNWTSGVLSDLALPAAAENQSQVFVRWIMTSDLRVDPANPTLSVASGAGARIDDISIKGTALSTIAVSSPGPSSGNVLQGTSNHTIYRLNLTVAGSATTLNSLTVTTGGPTTGTGYITSDVQNFKLRYSTDAVLDAGDATLGTLSPVALGSNLVFSGLSQSIGVGTGYLFVTTDVSPTATLGSAISINAMPLANITFSNGTVSGPSSVSAGGAQTFVGNASASSVIKAVTGSEAASISSLKNGTISSNTDGVKVWQINLFDGDGVNDDADALPTRYSSLTISAASGNTVTNWGNTIESAQFFEGSNTTPIAGTIAIVNNIIAFTPTTPIIVADGAGSNKTISLRITLKNSLPAGSDGKVFRFQLVDGLVGVEAETISSQLFSFTANSASAKNIIDVTATALTFSNVPGSVFINTNFALTVSATDVYGNIDTGYMSDISINLGLGNGSLSALSGLSTKSLVSGSYSWNDIQYDFAEDFQVDVTDHSGGLPYNLSPIITATMLNFTSFDNFNRGDNILLGTPSSGSGTWSEMESAGSNNYRVRVSANGLVMSSWNDLNSGSVGIEQAAFNMSAKYATTFAQAAGDLVWAFNMRQTQANPTGFSNGNGAAFVLGSSEQNFSSPTAYGYAVVLGNTGIQKTVRLVRFAGGITNNSNLTTIASVNANATDYYSVKVQFNPCTKDWSLMVRNDGTTSFGDPGTLASGALTGTDYLYTDSPLNYMGAYWYHQIGNVNAYFDNFYIPNAATSTPETYVWNGSNSTDFSDENNWTPLRGCIRKTDLLVFNSGNPTTVINVATQQISNLTVTNNTTLTLKPLSGTTETLTIVDATGDDLVVAAGSSLIIDGNNPLEISLATGATAKVTGTVQVQNTVNNLGRAHRIMAADANAIVFDNGGRFIAKNLSGEAFGNTGTPNTVIFKSNATYVSRDGAGPFGLTAPDSKVKFETGSVYSHEQISNLPKLDGRTYADFELNVPSSISILAGNSAGDAATFNNFTVINGSISFPLSSGGLSQPLIIKGNLSVAPGSQFDFSPSTASAASLVKFSGSAAQQINGTVIFGTNANLELNNGAGLTTNTDLAINGNLTLTQGTLTFSNKALTLRGLVQGSGSLASNNLSDLTIEGTGAMGTLNFATGARTIRNLNLDRKSSGTVTLGTDLTISGTAFLTNGVVNLGASLLKFVDNAAVTGASDNSYVNGVVVKTGDDAFIFPVGVAGYYAPVGISAPLSVTDQFTAEYIRSNPQSTFGSAKAGSLARVSQVEYWNVQRTAGTSDVFVNLSFQDARSVGVGQPSDLRVARFNAGTGWSDEGTLDLASSDNEGTLSTSAKQASFGSFTLGSTTTLNPLPVELVSFKAMAKTKTVALTWETASEQNSDRFEIQRSSDSRNFETIASVKAQGNSNYANRYAATDEKPLNGTSYYRLKQIDQDGTFTYSKVEAVQFAAGEPVVRMYPNPTRDRMTVTFGQQLKGELQIINAIGQTVKTIKMNSTGSDSEMELNLTELPAGTYHLRLISDRSSQMLKFVKMN